MAGIRITEEEHLYLLKIMEHNQPFTLLLVQVAFILQMKQTNGVLKKSLNCAAYPQNRVARGFSPPAPTTPRMRGRTGRFDMLSSRSRIVHVHPEVLDGNHALLLQPVIRHAKLRRVGL